ncbi:CRP/FNR family transcriptional regulator, anaerobic regulatory protein [Chitinophaga ginsengisegetis]|uniref:CRP/FNR family transcriptional regulator, anaerobic regulatory protein n=1 Tax=Chitinophaga ginsengisegetis TaxID=393003 RepID=A0A1T5NCQ4_9BACT|nr:Crp/Fnr family transcriptional regulator [Chitinophaga ginsengisegetis]SKC97959.1 CRP/FNR family transcriptional regulator, anaerobic regulatory protein [Chitinophaga ginsengisegetis]
MQEQYPIRKLFPGLEEGLYEEMMKHGDIREIPAGTVMLRKGQSIRSTMLILQGIVKLYQEDEEGNEFFMYDIEPGEACAVSMVCTYRQENSQVVAKALTDVTVLTIPLQYMDEWLGKYKSWHYFVIRTWRARYEELLNTINEIAFKNMDERLEFYIKGQVKKMGRQIKLTHQEIATDLNSSREVISRLMKKMEKNGWVIIHRNSFEWIKP